MIEFLLEVIFCEILGTHDEESGTGALIVVVSFDGGAFGGGNHGLRGSGKEGRRGRERERG